MRHCPHSPAARRCCGNRSISPAHRTHISKSAAAGLLPWDSQMGGHIVLFHTDFAPHTAQAAAISSG